MTLTARLNDYRLKNLKTQSDFDCALTVISEIESEFGKSKMIESKKTKVFQKLINFRTGAK